MIPVLSFCQARPICSHESACESSFCSDVEESSLGPLTMSEMVWANRLPVWPTIVSRLSGEDDFESDGGGELQPNPNRRWMKDFESSLEALHVMVRVRMVRVMSRMMNVGFLCIFDWGRWVGDE